MSRTSLLEQLAEPFADLPPLAGILAAVLLGIVGWAAPLFASASAIAEIWLQFGRWLAWLLGALVLAYTVAGAGRRFIDRRRFDGTEDLASLRWGEFERLIAEFYRRTGARVVSRGGPKADGGVDLELTETSGQKLIVQCKHWKNRLVGVKPLRELWGVLGDERADGAIFITSGSYSANALAFARGKKLDLVDGPRLRAMIAEVKRTGATMPRTNPQSNATGPACPRCGSSMILRTARRGANAGKQFWGCSTYPACNGTLPLTS